MYLVQYRKTPRQLESKVRLFKHLHYATEYNFGNVVT